jgi:signal transduction histidine kinase/ActR/RegA family two-component response regulator
VAGFGLLTVIIAATFWFVTLEGESQSAVRQVLNAKTHLYRVQLILMDAETGQRGYLLTGEDAYLAPYERATASLEGEVEALALAVAGDPRQAGPLQALKLLIAEKLAELKATIEEYRGGNNRKALALVHGGTGKSLMDQTGKTLASMSAEEDRLLAERRADMRRAGMYLRISVGAAAALLVALAIFAVRHALRQGRRLIASRDALRTSNEKLMQEALQREQLEEQLRQSQKMEALGQLTGGLAHDFNNMLAVIISSMELVQRRLARGESDVRRFIDSAVDASERAATLIKRLLTFARRQPLAPEPIDANKFVAGMSDLLRRTLGEHVRLETILAGGLWRTHADPAQLESAILNLAVNARDAMPSGGRLTIETANCHLDDNYAARHAGVPAGQYVLVAVSDTGTGMAQEVIAKAFDPFFTTKSAGKGTGLGLSQVYGFVKQSGGHVKIYSELGHGTAVKIYLPRFFPETGQVSRSPVARAMPAASAGETVLVVEDEKRARQITAESLRELGYKVLEADGAASALRIIDAQPEIDLLLTDVIMPDVNGKKLAEEAQRRRPSLKVLYTSGYTRNAIVHNAVLDPSVHFVPKPFTLEHLAMKVREALETETELSPPK